LGLIPYNADGCHSVFDGFIGGQEIRKSLDMREWEKAQDKIREWEAAGEMPASRGAVVRQIDVPALRTMPKLLGPLDPDRAAASAILPTFEQETVEGINSRAMLTTYRRHLKNCEHRDGTRTRGLCRDRRPVTRRWQDIQQWKEQASPEEMCT
jgi:hypothetical protein